MTKLEKIFDCFLTDCQFLDASPLGKGNIHETYRIESKQKKSFVLQKINTWVFRDPVLLMKNAGILSNHLEKKLADESPGWVFPVFYPSREGEIYTVSGNDDFWRLMDFIPNTPPAPDEREIFKKAGSAYGQFIRLLSDLPVQKIGDSIPDFHNLPFRMEKFREILESGERKFRDSAIPEIEKLLEFEEQNTRLCKMESSGVFPQRLTHKDTKIDNILFDEKGKPMAIIDLDTVMPGIVHSDFGDAIRSFANSAEEDEKDLESVSFNIDVFHQYAKGFTGSLKTLLTTGEKESLYLAPAMWTYMQAVRFLTDYLDGSRYYRISYPEHNLFRTRNQIRLLELMEEKSVQMKGIIMSEFDR